MPIELPDLWSDDIKVDVLPPLVILKAQDEGISRRTQGILRAEVSTFEEEEDTGPEDEEPQEPDPDAVARPARVKVTHTLDLVAPALTYRETLLTVTHDRNRVYPATLMVADPLPWDHPGPADPPSRTVVADSAEQLIAHLRKALRSSQTRAAIDSLLALSNERRLKPPAPPNGS